MERGLRLVEILDELPDAALVAEPLGLAVALVCERDLHAGVEEGEFSQAVGERREGEVGRLEDVGVGPEPDRRAGVFARFEVADALEAVLARFPAVEGVAPHRTVAPYLDFESLRQRVDDRDADAVEATGDLVRLVVELPAGVEDGHDDLHGRPVVLLVCVHGDAPSVVGDRDGLVLVNRHADVVTVACKRLVDGVVDDLVDEMVKPASVRRPDIHGGSFPDGL